MKRVSKYIGSGLSAMSGVAGCLGKYLLILYYTLATVSAVASQRSDRGGSDIRVPG